MAVQTGQELNGLAVVTLAGGERQGRIEDISFHIATGRLVGFWVTTGGLIAHSLFLPTENVQSVGADALIVATHDALLKGHKAASPDEFQAKALDGRTVLSESGTVLGKIADVLIDTDALTVPAFALATGFLTNALHGKPHLPLSFVKTVGPDSVIVSNDYTPNAPSTHP